uniref:uncharacterized protein LOC122602956 n=1 Tax=Erigeron canadensis TaxID=72917 RepID=UPI001CB979E4|nr:uncharacterized protein LOC122602956 [Erigeron canadensis]
MEPPRGNKRNTLPPPKWAPPPNCAPPLNHNQAPPPPNRYYTPPPPSTHYSQTHQQQYYTPQPASPAYGYNTSASQVAEEEKDDEVEECDARGKKKFAGRKPRELWTEAQEVALAQAWIQILECKKFGNEQKAKGFWKRILQHYATTLGSTTRTFHSLTTKWKVMNAEMGNFNGLLIQAQCLCLQRPFMPSNVSVSFRAKGSGCNDLDITTTALSDYYTKTDKHLTHLPAWNVVKDHDKWKQQECFSKYCRNGNPDV